MATNRQASWRYHLLERYEAGLVLTGTEVKALRASGAQLKDAYAVIRGGEAWLIGCYIAPYGPANRANHDPERERKLLLHRSEIERLIGKTQERGLTLIPTRVYFKGAHAKVGSPWPAARTGTTSASRSASAMSSARSSASFARGSRLAGGLKRARQMRRVHTDHECRDQRQI